MKYTTINAYRAGLVFRNGAYKRVITEGGNWLRFSERIYEYDMTKQFVPPCELSILLNDAKLAAMLEIVQVNDNAIALMFEDGIFKNILVTGRYAFWKGPVKRTFMVLDLDNYEIPAEVDRSLLNRKELLNYIRAFVVE